MRIKKPDWKLSSAILGTVIVVSGVVFWYIDSFSARAVGRLIASVEDVRPFVSAEFDVYLDGNRLVYVKEECGAEDVDALFFLHLNPVDEADLPDSRRQHGFDNLDFAFEMYGFRGGGRCAAALALPEYGIASIYTGQYMPGREPEWSGMVSVSVPRSTAADSREIDELIASVEGTQPIIAGGFDVYLDGNRLVYVKEECGAEDVAWFFLHLNPVDEADLPDSRRQHGFDNLDFAFEMHGFRGGGRCAAVRALPEYGIASIYTGQYMPGQDPEWSGMASVSAPQPTAADSREIDELIASVEDARPIIAGGFDVYLDGNRLVYVKEECGAADVDAWFFLHLYPVDAEDLQGHRRRHGFDNLDFAFERYGLRGDGRCVVERIVPEYRIASVHTGQYQPGRDAEWSERVNITDASEIDELIAGVEDARPMIIAGGFNVYLDGNRLVYVKEECGAEDADDWFFLHLYPVDGANLPDDRKPHGFDNLDFNLDTHGHRFGGRCAAVRALPEYGIASVHTGQYTPGLDPSWSGRVGSSVLRSTAAASRDIDGLFASVEDARPVVSGDFDVYLDGENRLVYVKEECGAEDADALFFLHLYPVDEAALPDRRRPHGFDNLDFAFERYGFRDGGRCAAVRVLPEYELASIHTGRYAPGQDPAWSGSVSFPVSWRFATARAIDELIVGVEDAPPVVSGDFDVYLDGNRLVYVKEGCGAADVDALFFLHLYPIDEAALPDPRQPHGFDNLDFAFETYGRRAGGRCAAVRVLPEYAIASIRTGQFVPGQDPEWIESVNLAAHAP